MYQIGAGDSLITIIHESRQVSSIRRKKRKKKQENAKRFV
jgi:hypothetical protein